MRKTKRLTLSAILSALSVIIVYLGSLIEIFDIGFVILASFIIVFAQMEIKAPYQYLIYCVCSVLCFLLLPNKYTASLYILFGGLYPLVRVWLERLPKVLRMFAKLLFFNALITLEYFAFRGILGVEAESLYIKIALFSLSNLIFILYDILIARAVKMYFFVYRKKIEKYLK